MKIIIQSSHSTPKPDLKKFITENVSKLFLINNQILSVEVFLKLEKATNLENMLCEVEMRINLPGHNLFAKNKNKTFQEATVQVIEALEKQILKQKTKKQDKRLLEA